MLDLPENIIHAIQILIAVSVLFVWTFRHHNVVKEFNQFGLSDLTRDLVGALKISLSALLIVGIWFPPVVFYAAAAMALLMVAAQYFHFKISNPFIKHLPSLVLLLLSVVVAIENLP
ncbi:MAG: DoxX family protein [Nonlabens sp.]